MRSTPSLKSFPSVAFETVPMFIWLTMALSHPFKEDHWVLPLSMPLSSRWLVVWDPWLRAFRYCLRLLNTSDLPRREPLVKTSCNTLEEVCCVWHMPADEMCMKSVAPNASGIYLRTRCTWNLLSLTKERVWGTVPALMPPQRSAVHGVLRDELVIISGLYDWQTNRDYRP